MRPSQFVDRQLLDVIQWSEPDAATLAYRYPTLDTEFQMGATLVVRETEMAVFVDEGRIADAFGPGRHVLNAAKLPLLAGLKKWDQGFALPFRSDIYFFSTQGEMDQKWGTCGPIPLGDTEAGAILLRSFGSYSYRIADPRLFFAQVSGTRESYFIYDLDDRLRHTIAAGLEERLVASGNSYPNLIADAAALSDKLMAQIQPVFATLGLELSQFTIQAISFEDALQPLRDQRMGRAANSNFQSEASVANCYCCGASMRTDHGILKCDYCHTVVVAVSDEDDVSRGCERRACPACEIPLIQATVGEALLSYCTRCDGMLVAMDEFEALVAASRALPSGPVPFEPAETAALPDSVACPECRRAMGSSFYGGNVEIDSCEDCGLNWLNHDALSRIAHGRPTRFELAADGSNAYFNPAHADAPAGTNAGA